MCFFPDCCNLWERSRQNLVFQTQNQKSGKDNDGNAVLWSLPESDTAIYFSQVSIAVGLAGFACVLLLVLFVLINKYGRRSKFGMKGKSTQIVRQAERQSDSYLCNLPFCQLHHCAESIPLANLLYKKPLFTRKCTYAATVEVLLFTACLQNRYYS